MRFYAQIMNPKTPPKMTENTNTHTNTNTTHFGFKEVLTPQKAKHVAQVFDSVATRYDLMNDAMSGGLHRLWKAATIQQSGVREGSKVLDIAGGTGDLSRAFLQKSGKSGEVWLTDINKAMLKVGRDNLYNQGLMCPLAQCDAEKLPFPSDYFDCVCVAFGLRNMTHKDNALQEMYRVLKKGGRLLVLEFSEVNQLLKKPYDFYSFKIIPKLGQMFAGDAASYQYLAESIRKHPNQETLKNMLQAAGFLRVDYHNFTFGVVALHRGFKF